MDAHRRVFDAENTTLVGDGIVEESQNTDLHFALSIVRQVSEIRQETDEEVKVTCLVRVGAGEHVANVGNRNDRGVSELLLRILLHTFVLFSIVLHALLLLLLLNFLYSRTTCCLIDELFTRRISSDVVFSDNLDPSVIIELLNVLRLLLSFSF